MVKYVKLNQVEELLKLYKIRDQYMDWTDSWDKYNRKIENSIIYIRNKAIEIDNENDEN